MSQQGNELNNSDECNQVIDVIKDDLGNLLTNEIELDQNSNVKPNSSDEFPNINDIPTNSNSNFLYS